MSMTDTPEGGPGIVELPRSELDVDPAEATAQIARNADARNLIQRWLTDESGYDERVWPGLKMSMERNRSSPRPPFHG